MADSKQSDDNARKRLDEDLSVHIFTVSATMVGVCLTVVGLIRVIISIRGIETLIDDMVAWDAMFFVVSGLLSFWALRSRARGRLHRVEAIAERVFLAGMTLMGISILVLVYGIQFL